MYNSIPELFIMFQRARLYDIASKGAGKMKETLFSVS